MRLAKVKSKTVKRLPLTIRLPDHFIKANSIMPNDVLDMYVSSTGELIIKKRGAK